MPYHDQHDPVFYNPGRRKRKPMQAFLAALIGAPNPEVKPRRRGLTKGPGGGEENRATRLQAERDKLMKQGHYPGPYMYTPDNLNAPGTQSLNQAFLDEVSPNVKLPYHPSIKGLSDTSGAGTLVLPKGEVENWGASTVRGAFPDIDKAWLANSATREAEKRKKFEDAIEDEMLWGPPAGPTPPLRTEEPLHMPEISPDIEHLRRAIIGPLDPDTSYLPSSTGDPSAYPALDRVFGPEQVRQWMGDTSGVFNRFSAAGDTSRPPYFYDEETELRLKQQRMAEELERLSPRNRIQLRGRGRPR